MSYLCIKSLYFSNIYLSNVANIENYKLSFKFLTFFKLFFSAYFNFFNRTYQVLKTLQVTHHLMTYNFNKQ